MSMLPYMMKLTKLVKNTAAYQLKGYDSQILRIHMLLARVFF